MNRNVIPVACFVIIIAALVALYWVIFDPHPWSHMAVPLVVIGLSFQAIAVWGGTGAKPFFQFLDYIHYGVVGTAVGVVSLYLLNVAGVERLNLYLEQQSLKQELQSTVTTVKDLQDEVALPEPTDDDFRKACFEQDLQRRLREQGNPREGATPVLRIDPCRGAFDMMARKSSAKRALEASIAREKTIKTRLGQIDSEIVQIDSRSAGPPSFEELRLRFMLFPTLIFFGAAIKLGKTTQGIVQR